MTTIDPMPPPVPAAATAPSARPGTPDFLHWLQAAPGRDATLPDTAQHDGPLRAGTSVPPLASSSATGPALLSAQPAPLPQGAIAPGVIAPGLLAPALLAPQAVVSEPVDVAELFDLAQRAGAGELWASAEGDAATDWLPAGQFALRLRGGDAQEALVALPWRLAANGRLEHSALLMRPLWLMQGTPPAGVSTTALGGAPPGAPGAVAAAQAGQSAASGAVAALPLQWTADAVRAVRAAPSEDAATLARAPAFGEWALRWTRWIERDGRDPAVWLRDFRLDEQGVRRLTDTLRAFAREHGFALERIVVNGREQWRAAGLETDATPFPQQPQE